MKTEATEPGHPYPGYYHGQRQTSGNHGRPCGKPVRETGLPAQPTGKAGRRCGNAVGRTGNGVKITGNPCGGVNFPRHRPKSAEQSQNHRFGFNPVVTIQDGVDFAGWRQIPNRLIQKFHSASPCLYRRPSCDPSLRQRQPYELRAEMRFNDAFRRRRRGAAYLAFFQAMSRG